MQALPVIDSVECLDAAAVHHQHLSADPIGYRRCEIEHGSCDVGYLAKAVYRRMGQHLGLYLGGKHCRQGMCACRSRTDVVDAIWLSAAFDEPYMAMFGSLLMLLIDVMLIILP